MSSAPEAGNVGTVQSTPKPLPQSSATTHGPAGNAAPTPFALNSVGTISDRAAIAASANPLIQNLCDFTTTSGILARYRPAFVLHREVTRLAPPMNVRSD